MDNINLEKLGYVLCFVESYIDRLIGNVLNDSKEDPHYSAVTATNLIKCYIQIMTEIGERLPYNDVRGFFKALSYTKENYAAFEKNEQKKLNIT
jgi:hypothetical protein